MHKIYIILHCIYKLVVSVIKGRLIQGLIAGEILSVIRVALISIHQLATEHEKKIL